MTPLQRIKRIQRWIGDTGGLPDMRSSHPYTSPGDKEELYEARILLADALMVREIEWLTRYAELNLGPSLPKEFDTESLADLYSDLEATREVRPQDFDYPDV